MFPCIAVSHWHCFRPFSDIAHPSCPCSPSLSFPHSFTPSIFIVPQKMLLTPETFLGPLIYDSCFWKFCKTLTRCKLKLYGKPTLMFVFQYHGFNVAIQTSEVAVVALGVAMLICSVHASKTQADPRLCMLMIS